MTLPAKRDVKNIKSLWLSFKLFLNLLLVATVICLNLVMTILVVFVEKNSFFGIFFGWLAIPMMEMDCASSIVKIIVKHV